MGLKRGDFDKSIDGDSSITKDDFNDPKNALRKIIHLFQSVHHIPDNEIKSMFSTENIPVEIFSISKLTTFEAICKYLHENNDLTFRKIAKILNRSNTTISSTYYRANLKYPDKFVVTNSDYILPLTLFNSKRSILESIVLYLIDNQKLRNKDVAKLLCRSPKTVSTVYGRALTRK